MNFSGTLLTILELAMVSFAIWAVFNEGKFVAFEERIKANIRRRNFKVIHGNGVSRTCYPKNYTEKHHA